MLERHPTPKMPKNENREKGNVKNVKKRPSWREPKKNITQMQLKNGLKH
jgi:hypothetical protein